MPATPKRAPRLPLLPEGATPIGEAAYLTVTQQGTAVYVWGTLWWSWQTGDETGRRLAAVQLALAKTAKRIDIAEAFGVTPETIWRWCRDYTDHGIDALRPAKTGPKGAWKLTDEVISHILALDAQGHTQAHIATTAGVSTFSVRQVLRDRQTQPTAPASDTASHDTGDQAGAVEDYDGEGAPEDLEVVPAPTPRTAERQAARYGQLEQAAPVFTQGRQLPLAGLLLALPGLEATGLLEVAESTYGQLRNGFYGLRSLLLTLVLLALLREPRAEGATRVVPADLGRILALDRAPEASTIRRRLGELAGRGQAGQLMQGLAHHHAKAHEDAVGFLYIDGHVRAYHGTRRLPKTRVARMRISMPATLETWVADANGDPVFAVMAPPSASTAAEIRRLLPDLRELIGKERRTTIVFDRGGWSPDLFAEIIDADFDLLTYRKGDIEPEDDDAFADYTWIDERGVEHHWRLADRQVELELSAKAAKRHGSKTITLRQIVRQSPDGHQTHILTTRMDLPAEQVAARMFNRWRQENYFRYAREHFALDALDSYTVVQDDLTRTVPNPAKAASAQRIKELEQTITEAEAALGRHRKTRRLKASCDELDAELDKVRALLATAQQEHAGIPGRVPLGDIEPDARLLDSETKLITHVCRIAAYNTESALARLAAPHYARAAHEARSLIREALTVAGDLYLSGGRVHVTLNALSAPRRTRALAAICEQLNDTETCYPGTDLVMHYTVKPHPGTT